MFAGHWVWLYNLFSFATPGGQYRPVAQLAERLSPKQEVVGSIPAWPASRKENAV